MNVLSVRADIRSQHVAGSRIQLARGERQVGVRVLAMEEERGSASGKELQARALTPVKVDRLEVFLAGYDRPEDSELLVRGFRNSFRLGYQGPRVRRWAENLRSVHGKEELVQKKLRKEVREGRMAGPFSFWPLRNLIVSPIGVVPKKEKGQFRLIHHLSWSEGASVNDFIPEDFTKVSYASVDVAVHMVEQLGPGALMAKTDIKSAFWLLPVHPDDF
ncbi:hypothetical protein NDU88_002285 [Pleurodeles waltl]|uniref:Reverse transcriptase domain-containing protein n=1 Tax=Pleurodeles waltl TaxID=8319 RepID=A0AAV7LFJ1_PLEWA|nr:hypothetical protein NDU88_002285 [Pleurodeles waltl]